MEERGRGGARPGKGASWEVGSERGGEVAEAQRCGGGERRVRNARGRGRGAAEGRRDAGRAERERLQGVLAASDCRVPE